MKSMGNFYSKMNEAVTQLSNSLDDTKAYSEQVANLKKNLTSLNGVYGNILSSYKNMGGGNN